MNASGRTTNSTLKNKGKLGSTVVANYCERVEKLRGLNFFFTHHKIAVFSYPIGTCLVQICLQFSPV